MSVLEDCANTEDEFLPGCEEVPESKRPKLLQESKVQKLFAEFSVVDLEPSAQLGQQANNIVLVKVLEELGLRLVEDGYVKWRRDATDHPRNFSAARKTFDTGLVLLLDLFTCVSHSVHHCSNANVSQNCSQHCWSMFLPKPSSPLLIYLASCRRNRQI